MADVHWIDPMDRISPFQVPIATEPWLLRTCQFSSSSALGRMVQSLVG